jgi:hypothetical protein
MNVPTFTESEQREESRAGRRWPRILLRSLISIHALVVCAQGVSAGRFLDGDYDMLEVHSNTATGILSLAPLVVIAAIVDRAAGNGSAWPSLGAAGLFGGEFLQYELGHREIVALHVPLGIGLITLNVLLLIWVWRTPAVAGRIAEAGKRGDR